MESALFLFLPTGKAEYFSRGGWTGFFDLPVGQISEMQNSRGQAFQRIERVEPTGPAFGRPDDKLRDTHQSQFAEVMDFAKRSTHPTYLHPLQRVGNARC
jgi:hypothetical protein